MQIFLDSADINEIKEINDFGIISGITTNPSLISRITNDFAFSIKEICRIIAGDVSVEIVADNFDGMIEQGNKILTLADNIVIKLPMTWEGVKACKYFSGHNIKVNMTLCFSSNQALVAASAGATYISPFIGRLDDIGFDGMELIQNIRVIYNNYKNKFNTKILAASIRNPSHFYRAALIGADVATMPGNVIKQLLNYPLTASGLKTFNKDWFNSKLKI